MKTWTCLGLEPVQARTKSEARAAFKRQLQALEALTFRPKKISRLPVGAKVRAA